MSDNLLRAIKNSRFNPTRCITDTDHNDRNSSISLCEITPFKGSLREHDLVSV